MKTLYLFRHAKSSWKETHLNDFERPLNKRGLRDAPLMGQILSQKSPKPALWLSSPAVRAWSTALIVAEQCNIPATLIQKSMTLYEANTQTILRVIHTQADEEDSMVVFGHNPGLTELANQLCAHEFDNIPTSGMIGIQFNTPTWQAVGNMQGELLFFDYPKKHLDL